MKFDPSKLNTKQKDNLQEALRLYHEKSAISSPSPVVLFIELTRNCNASCAFCRSGNWENHPSFNMPPELFDKVLCDYVPYASLVDLRGKGESLLLPNFSDYLKRVAAYGPKIRLVTTLGCGTQETLQSLVDYDVFVSVSFDAADKEFYEKTRRGIQYDTVIRNLEFVASRMLAKYGGLEGRLQLSISPLQRDNLPHVEGILKLANRLGIKDILIGPLSGGCGDGKTLDFNQYETLKVLERCVYYSNEFGIRFSLTRPPFDAFRIEEKVFDQCCHPWFFAQITYGGDLIFCDHLLGMLQCSLGNISKPKELIWNGERTQMLRSAHVKGSSHKLLDACANCYRQGRYAEFEQLLSKDFSKWQVSDKEIATFLPKLASKKSLLQMNDLAFKVSQSSKTFLKERFPRAYTVGKKVKEWVEK